MAADVTVLTTTVNLNTSTGTQDITVGSLGTSPKAAIIFAGNVTGANNEEVHPAFSVGFTDGTNQNCMYVGIENGLASSVTARGQDSTDLLRVINESQNVRIAASFSAWITNGIRINVDTNTESEDIKATFILFFGADVSNALTGAIDNITSGTKDVNTVGFEPDLVFFSTVGLTGNTASTGHCIMSFGVAHNGGNQGSIYFSDVSGLTTTSVSTLLETDDCVGQLHNGSLTWAANCNTFDASGFSLTVSSGGGGGDDAFYLALKFTNSPDIAVTTETGPTSTGNWSTTAPAFQPDFGMLWTLDNTATDTIDATDSDGFGVWCFDGTREYSIGMSSDDNVGTSDAYNRHSSDLTDYKDGNTTLHAGSFVSFDTNGATLNFTTVPATARKWIGIWIGDASAGGGGPSTPTGQMALLGAGL